jgi:hypothetical protein
MDGKIGEKQASASGAEQPVISREQDGIYQGNRLVAKAIEVEIDMDAKEVRFGVIHESDRLMIPEECEYQKFRLMIQRIGYASKNEKDGPHQGRILRGVIADIMGYREN